MSSELENIVGKNFFGFNIEKKIGEGGFGQVFIAKQIETETDYCLKVIDANKVEKFFISFYLFFNLFLHYFNIFL